MVEIVLINKTETKQTEEDRKGFKIRSIIIMISSRDFVVFLHRERKNNITAHSFFKKILK